MTLDPVDHGHVLAIVRQNPIRPGENWPRYIDRIAVMAGLIPENQAALEHVKGWSSAGEVADEPRSEWWDGR